MDNTLIVVCCGTHAAPCGRVKGADGLWIAPYTHQAAVIASGTASHGLCEVCYAGTMGAS